MLDFRTVNDNGKDLILSLILYGMTDTGNHHVVTFRRETPRVVTGKAVCEMLPSLLLELDASRSKELIGSLSGKNLWKAVRRIVPELSTIRWELAGPKLVTFRPRPFQCDFWSIVLAIEVYLEDIKGFVFPSEGGMDLEAVSLSVKDVAAKIVGAKEGKLVCYPDWESNAGFLDWVSRNSEVLSS